MNDSQVQDENEYCQYMEARLILMELNDTTDVSPRGRIKIAEAIEELDKLMRIVDSGKIDRLETASLPSMS